MQPTGDKGDGVRRLITVGVAALLAFAAAPLCAATAATGATVSGTVTTASDGAPAGHICVAAIRTADSLGAGSTVTAADGTYSLAVPAGSYWLRYDDCSGGDLIEQYWKGVASEGDATTVTVADGDARTGMNIAMAMGGAISGIATDTAGNPMSVMVSVAAVDHNWAVTPLLSGSTRPDGTFTIHGVTPSTYQVSFDVSTTGNYMPWWYGDVREAKDAATVSVTAGAITSGVVVHIPHPATVSGTVRGDDGAPYADACVGVFYSDEAVAPVQTHTAADGTYSLPNVAPGPVRVKFTDCSGVTAAQWYQGAPDYASATEIDLAEGGAASPIDGVLARGLSISGKVVDDKNQPVANEIVDVYDALTGLYTGRGVWTDSTGHYAISGLRGATYKLLFRGSRDLVARWWPASPTSSTALPLVLTTGVSLSDINITLPHGASVSGTIVDESGQPVKGVCVQPEGGIGAAPTYVITDDAGHYTATGLDEGTYNFLLSSCGTAQVTAFSWLGGTDVRSTATTLTVALGQVVGGADGVAHPGGGISGTVTDTSGHPLANIWVHPDLLTSYETCSVPEAFTDSNGHFAFQELWPRNDYRLRFSDPSGTYVSTYLGGADFNSATPVSVTAGADSSGHDVTLYRAGFLTGSVVDQFGARVARVSVSAKTGNNWSEQVLTDDSGNFRIGGLLPGTYSLYYSDGGAGLFFDPVSGAYTTSNSGSTFDVTEGNTTSVPQAQVTVITTPGAPVSVSTVAGDASALVSWVAPTDTGHSPLTGFQVRMDGQVVATASGTSHSAFVPHLVNNRSYSLTVDAVNAKGAGDPSAAVSVVPKPASALTLARSPAGVVYGGSTVLSGRLSRTSTGTALTQRVVALYRRAPGAAAWQAMATTHTTSTGHYSFSVRPLGTTDYRVSYESSDVLPTASTTTVNVLPRASVVRQSNHLVATVSPGQTHQLVELQRVERGSWRAVSVRALDHTGHASFALTRTGVYRIYVRSTSRLAGAWSSRVRVASL